MDSLLHDLAAETAKADDRKKTGRLLHPGSPAIKILSALEFFRGITLKKLVEAGITSVRGQVTIHVRGHQVLRAEPRFR
jgi:hypothetical protein